MPAEIHNLITHRNISPAKALLQSLVPRAQCFCFYGLDRACAWSSDGVDDYEIDTLVADLPAEIVAGSDPESAFLKRTLNSGRTILLMPIFGEANHGLGLLVAVFSKNAGKSSWFNPSLLKNILLPAVQVIGETLRLNRALADTQERHKGTEQELALVYKVDEKVHGTSRSHAGLAELIGQSGRFLNIAYSVLLLPSKRIRISATHSSWKSVNRKSVDKYLIEKLFPQVEGTRSPKIFEIPRVEGSDHIADQGYQAMLCPLQDGAGNLEGVIAQLARTDGQAFDDKDMRFMSHISRKVDYVIRQSFDPMTGLMNRSGFETQLVESGKALAAGEDAHQIIYFDLDNLQLVNDTFGRTAGDQVIVRFSQVLQNVLPKNAVASRLTGDDFVVLLTHSSLDDAMELARSVRGMSGQLRYLEGDRSLQVSVSVGIAAFNTLSTDAGSSVTAARIACDSAKEHGRDRIEVHDADDQSIVRRYDDMHLVAQIQKAIDEDSFGLIAQPIVSVTGDKVPHHYEILLRMQDGHGDPVPSTTLISAAERYQLMPQIDRWVVSATMRKLAEHADFLKRTGAIFAVNLSGQTLGDDDILAFIEDEIDAAGVPSTSLCFEITESAAVSNHQRAQAFIDALRKRGCRFALDDFGAGLSSFAYLRNFSVDLLKIDGSFIRGIADNRISQSMVAAITQVAKVMELQTVAEFVETPEILKLVSTLGVHFAQGHAVGRPVGLDSVLRELTSSARTA